MSFEGVEFCFGNSLSDVKGLVIFIFELAPDFTRIFEMSDGVVIFRSKRTGDGFPCKKMTIFPVSNCLLLIWG